MKIVIGGRRHGKTKRCIELAAESGATIVCASKVHADQLWNMAKDMGVSDKLKFPLLFDDVITGVFSRDNITGFIFDNLDVMVKGYCDDVPVEAMTFTDEDMNFSDSHSQSLIAGDDPHEDLNRVTSVENRGKIQEFYDKVVVPGLKSKVEGKWHDDELESTGDNTPSRLRRGK